MIGTRYDLIKFPFNSGGGAAEDVLDAFGKSNMFGKLHPEGSIICGGSTEN